MSTLLKFVVSRRWVYITIGFIIYMRPMKSFREKMSITKLVFLIMIVSLCVFTGYYVFSGQESTEMIVAFISVATVITNYYFKDKDKKDYPDSLMEGDLDKSNKI